MQLAFIRNFVSPAHMKTYVYPWLQTTNKLIRQSFFFASVS